MSGSITSRTMRSGGSRTAAVTASAPVAAEVTANPAKRRLADSSSRTTGSSSTTRRLITSGAAGSSVPCIPSSPGPPPSPHRYAAAEDLQQHASREPGHRAGGRPEHQRHQDVTGGAQDDHREDEAEDRDAEAGRDSGHGGHAGDQRPRGEGRPAGPCQPSPPGRAVRDRGTRGGQDTER